MSKKEREQLIAFEKIKNGEITKTQAALRLGITKKWVRKKFRRFLADGAKGLVHKNRHRVSERRWDKKENELTIALLKTEWNGFGPSFTAEKLAERMNITVSGETVRKAMISAGIWQAKRQKIRHCKRRERRGMIGLMVQLDGSTHDWFEGRAPKCTLLVFIDDATSKLLWLEFVKSESHIGVMKATRNYMTTNGIPCSFYVDFGSVFSVNLNNPERDKKTQWERVIAELSVEVLHAHSPQAKGRVERSNRTLQDRLIKEMRLAGVSSAEAANQFVRESDFISKHNQRFAVRPAQDGDAHKPTESHNLNDVFCLKEERILANDYTISHNKRILQLGAQQPTIIRPKNTITVKTYLDGSTRLSVRNAELVFSEINARKSKPVQPKTNTHVVHENSRRWVSGLAPLSMQNTCSIRRVG